MAVNDRGNLRAELSSLADRLNVLDLNETRVFPKYFEIETYRGCNARCTMCTVYDWIGTGTTMKPELFGKLADEIKQYSSWVERVTLSRDGEPLLDRFLVDRIKALKTAGVKYVTFSTNGSALTEKRAIQLIESGLDDIRLSTDGITKETFEKIRVGLRYEQVMENFLRFIQLRNERGTKPTIQVRMALQEGNRHEEAQWIDFWGQKIGPQDLLYSKEMHNWGNQLGTYEGHDKDERYDGKPCISPWSTMAIHADGKVGLCGCDSNSKVFMGDANTQSIKEIWQSAEYQRARDLHQQGRRNDINLCIGCNVWDLDVKKVVKKVYDPKGAGQGSAQSAVQ